MKVMVCILFAVLIFVSLFILASKYSPNKVLKTLLLSLGGLVLCAIIVSAFINTSNEINSNIFFIIYVTSVHLKQAHYQLVRNRFFRIFVIYFHK